MSALLRSCSEARTPKVLVRGMGRAMAAVLSNTTHCVNSSVDNGYLHYLHGSDLIKV